MTIKFMVRDWMGARHVSGEIPTGGFALIVGLNAAGKSSTIRGIGSCLAQESNPFGLTKAQLGQYAHNGSALARATLRIDDKFSVEMSPTEGIKSELGNVPYGPRLAVLACAGLADPTEWREKGGLEEWRELFKGIDLSFEIFAAALLRDFDFPTTPESIAEGKSKEVIWARRLYDEVGKMGIDSVLEQYLQKSRASKREWENIVGLFGSSEKYGNAKAGAWTPPGWLPEWEAQSLEIVQTEIQERRDELDVAKGNAVVGSEKIENWQSIVAAAANSEKVKSDLEGEIQRLTIQRDGLSTPKNEEEKTIGAAVAAATRAEEDFQNAYAVGTGEKKETELACPHCGEKSVLKDGVLELPGGKIAKTPEKKLTALDKTAKELRAKSNALEDAFEKAQEEIDTSRKGLNANISRFTQEIGAINHRAEQASYAQKKIEENTVGKGKSSTEEEISAAQTAVRDAEEKEKIFRAYHGSRQAHKKVGQFKRIITCMSDGSVAAEYSKAGIGGINEWLTKFCTAAKITKVEVGGGVVLFGGRAVSFCSESEQWQARFVCQIALAKHFSIPLILADRMDVLDGYNAGVFLNVLKRLRGSVTIIAAATERKDFASYADVVVMEGGNENDKQEANDDNRQSDRQSVD